MATDGRLYSWIYVLTFWLYCNAVAQQMQPESTLDLPQQQEQPRPSFPDGEHQSMVTSETSNMTPLDLNICSDGNYRPVDTLPGLRRSTEVRTLQLGQSGVIWPMANRTIPFNTDCYLQLSACSACQIVISWNTPLTDIRSQSATDQQQAPADRGCESVWDFRDRPSCVDLRLVEADADQTTLKPYQRLSLLNAPPEYRGQFVSSSYKLDFNLQFWRGNVERANALRGLFPLKYMVIDNTRIIRGRPSPVDLPTNISDGYITSPRFPKTYPEGVTVNYTFVNEDPDGAVRLIFTDFRLHYMSILKILDSNGQEIASTQSQYGTSQRPAAIQSYGNSLTVIFIANNYKHDIGFRANYRFVKNIQWLDRPSLKPCDKVYEDIGGTITIESLNLDTFSYVDCIWILEKPRYAPIGFDKLYLKVEDFSVISGGKGLELDVHVGRTSMNRRLLTIFGPKSSEQLAREQPQEGFISDTVLLAAAEKAAATTSEEDDSDTGFYLRLRGYLGSASGMSVVFAQFYRWATAICHDQTEFHCDNGRCISNQYRCDSHDHCGDFSDEIKCQNHGSKGRSGSMAGTGADEATDGSTFSLSGYSTTILLVAGLIGLTLVLLMVTVIVARIYRQKLLRRFAAAPAGNANSDIGESREDGLDASSVNNGSSNAVYRSSSTAIMMAMDEQQGSRPAPTLHQVGNRRLLMLPDSDIGVLEAPPTYDDALKHPTVPPSSTATLLRLSQQNPTLSLSNGSRPASGISQTVSGDAPLPGYPGPSTDQVASFDNPTFDHEAEPTANGAGGRQRSLRGRRRGRQRSRSGDSNCSSDDATSVTEDDASSSSCTGSDAEATSGCEIGVHSSVPASGGEPQDASASRSFPHDQPVIGNPAHSTKPSSGEQSAVSPANMSTSSPTRNVGTRKPPVPLPRSSLTRSLQPHLTAVTAGSSNGNEATEKIGDTVV